MRPRLGLLGLLGRSALVLSLAACGGGVPRSTNLGNAPGDEAGRVAAFEALEDEVIRGLAASDRRIAARARLEPREEDVRRLTMGAVLAEDPSLAVIDGAIDPFSFDARARGLAAAKAKLGSAPAGLPTAGRGTLSSPAFEKELLDRLVDAELVRLEEERMLPGSASALVRAVVETWSPPATPRRAAERDRWLARRLGEVRDSVTSGEATGATGATNGGEATGATNGGVPLDVVRARELDDALDALEHAALASGLVGATAELVKLRESLEAQAARPAAAARSDWSHVGRRVRTHLGLTLTPEGLEARLSSAERALRAASEGAIVHTQLTGDVLATRAAPLVFAGGECSVAVPGSRVRSMSPPPERAPACRLRQVVSAAADEAQRAHALVAMHDHVVVAQWALDVARGTATLAQATAKHRPLSRPGPDVVAHWERLALARPTAAIGAGFAAAVLAETQDPQARARAWMELGEVPLDVAEQELR